MTLENPEFEYYKQLLSKFQIYNEMVANNYFHVQLLNSSIYEFHGNATGVDMWHLEPVNACFDYESNSAMTDPENTYANYQGERIYFKATADHDVFKPDVFFIGIEDNNIYNRLLPDIVHIKAALQASNATKERLLIEYKNSYEGSLQHVKKLFADISVTLAKTLGSKYMNVSPNISFNSHYRCFLFLNHNTLDLVKVIANNKTFDINITSEDSELQSLLIDTFKPHFDAAEKVRMILALSKLSGKEVTDGLTWQ